MMRKSNWIVTGTSIAFISICCLGGCRTNPSPSVSSPSPTPKNATNEINSVKTQVTELKSQFKNLDSDNITTDKLPLPPVVNKLKSIQTEYDQFITNHPDSIKQDEDVGKSSLAIRQLLTSAVKIFDGLISKNRDEIINAQKELKDQLLKKYKLTLAYEINQEGIIDDSTMKAASDYLKKLAPDMEVKLNQLDTLLKQKKIMSDMTEQLKNLIEQSYSNQKKENSLYLYLTMFFLLAIILILLWQLNQTKEINKKVDTQTESIIKKLLSDIKIGESNKNITDIKKEIKDIKEIKTLNQEIKSMVMDFIEFKKESSKKLENQKTDPDSLPFATTDTTHESLLKEGETNSKVESLEGQLSEARADIVVKDVKDEEISQLKVDLQSNTSLLQKIEDLKVEREELENARNTLNTLNSELQESYNKIKLEKEDLYKQNQEIKTILEEEKTLKTLKEQTIEELNLNIVFKDDEITSLKNQINQLEINKLKPTITPPKAENVEVKIPPEITKLIEDFNQDTEQISSHIDIEVSLDKEMYEKLRQDSSLTPILKNSNNSNENNYLIWRSPNKADYYYYLIPKLNQFPTSQEHNKAKHLFQYIGYTEEKQRAKFVLDKPGKVMKFGQDWQLIEKGVLNFTSNK
ncbi:hypothetical protein BCD67_24005 [Oscillatoriales cyanobacterium USR001]|nr:hypothetical protein BCD67_24005 [Oscillatoriales cyanobacterium USR001]